MTNNFTNQSKSNWKIISSYIILLGLITYLLFQLRKAESGHSGAISLLHSQIETQQRAYNNLKRELGQSQKELSSYTPYKAVIRAASLRDSIYSLLPFKFGESAVIMPDSMPVIISSVSIIGNATDYSIKYVVRTKKGDYIQVSPSELKK